VQRFYFIKWIINRNNLFKMFLNKILLFKWCTIDFEVSKNIYNIFFANLNWTKKFSFQLCIKN